jgi:hypothetical protein
LEHFGKFVNSTAFSFSLPWVSASFTNLVYKYRFKQNLWEHVQKGTIISTHIYKNVTFNIECVQISELIWSETLSLTSDGGFSKSQQGFIVVTGHFINSQWKFQSCMLLIVPTMETQQSHRVLFGR